MELVKMLDSILEDYSDVRVAQLTGIERTRLNRIRNGKFRIEFNELKKIIETISVDDETAKKMYDRYLFEKLGRDKYNSRLLAKEFLSSMKTDDKNEEMMSNSAIRVELKSDIEMTGETMVFNSVLSVRRIITMLLMQAMLKNDVICVISSPNDEFLLSQIFNIMWSNPKCEIRHIFSLASNNELPEPLTYYMNVANAIYPLFMMNSGYMAYYKLAGHMTNALMPYTVLTDEYTVAFSPDYSSALISKNKDVNALYKRLFDEQLKSCTPFINRVASAYDFLRFYHGIMKSTAANPMGMRLLSIDFEPCMLQFFGVEGFGMMNEKAKSDPDAYNLLLRLEDELVPGFNDVSQDAFFTKKGVESFIETGRIAEIPETICPVFDYERRKEMLKEVVEMMKDHKDMHRYFLFKEDVFEPPMGLRFLGTGSSSDHLYFISNSRGGVRSILSFTNPEIKASVFDFVDSLIESDMIYTQEEMIAYMEQRIESM